MIKNILIIGTIDMARALGKLDAKEPMDFVKELAKLKKACGVDELKMSNYGVKLEELDKIAQNARETMGGLFKCDAAQLSHEDVIEIYKKSYK
jgi:alcohol dehydrogenase